jgi:hypothetical protein
MSRKSRIHSSQQSAGCKSKHRKSTEQVRAKRQPRITRRGEKKSGRRQESMQAIRQETMQSDASQPSADSLFLERGDARLEVGDALFVQLLRCGVLTLWSTRAEQARHEQYDEH